MVKNHQLEKPAEAFVIKSSEPMGVIITGKPIHQSFTSRVTMDPVGHFGKSRTLEFNTKVSSVTRHPNEMKYFFQGLHKSRTRHKEITNVIWKVCIDA